jgi:hypothetical protein
MSPSRVVGTIPYAQLREELRALGVRVSEHALAHVLTGDRGVYTDEWLLALVQQRKPRVIGVQQNGRYKAEYLLKEGVYVVILEKKHDRMEIITFIKPKRSLRRARESDKR